MIEHPGAALDLLLDAVIAFGLLALMFAPLERAFPAAARQPILRRELGLDLAFFAGQQLCFGVLILSAVSWLHTRGDSLPFAELRSTFRSQSLALQVLEVVKPLWRFHQVHHSAESLDWLAAHREHPLDGLYTQALMNLPMIATGVSLKSAAGVVVFRAVWAVFIHANVCISLGPLEWLVGSPRLHHWHHEKHRETINYGNLAPWTDLLFGTHYCPSGGPPSLGLAVPMRAGYLRMLIDPLRRQPPTSTSRPDDPSEARVTPGTRIAAPPRTSNRRALQRPPEVI